MKHSHALRGKRYSNAIQNCINMRGKTLKCQP